MTITVQTISLDLAKKIGEGAEKEAVKLGLKIVVAIMDQHGNLKYFARMDGNNFVSVRMAQLKAMTCASIAVSTKELSERNMTIPNGAYLGVPGIVLLEGGLPIFAKNGEHIGSIGVSGSTSQLDGVCAQAGLDAVADEL